MPFLLRHEADRSRPRVTEALWDLLLRAGAPGVLVFLALWGGGLALMGPLEPLSASEETVSRDVAQHGTPTLDTVSAWCSQLGSTGDVIAVCVVLVALVWWLTREWWYALIPGIAVALQASTFVAAARLYRGMHHVTDIGVGMLYGLLCATLAWLWVRRTERHAS